MSRLLNAMILVTLVFAILSGSAHANLIRNGDFETGTVGSTTIPEWETIGDIKIASDDAYPFLVGMDDQFALLGGCTTMGNAYLYQNFTLSEGATEITLTFDWAFSYVDASICLDDQLFVLYQNGPMDDDKAVGIITYSDILGTSFLIGAQHGEYTRTFDVSGATGSVMFTLQEVNAPFCWFDLTNSKAGIDNVSVEPNGAAPVPEPATLLLLGSGLMGAAAFRRKKD